MRKTLLTLMAATAIGMSALSAVAQDEVLEATVAGMEYKNCSYPINSNKNADKYQGCQTLYPASTMDAALQEAPAYAVKELILPFSNHKDAIPYPVSGKVQMTVYLGTSDDRTLDAFIPESELVEVFSGEIDLSNPQIQSEKSSEIPCRCQLCGKSGQESCGSISA